MDYILMVFVVVTVHIGYIRSQCDQNQAEQCLSTAQQQLDSVAQNQHNYDQYCGDSPAVISRPGVSECVFNVTAHCNKPVKENYHVQATKMLKRLSDVCSYYERQYSNQQTDLGSNTCDNDALLECHLDMNNIFNEDGWQNGVQKSLADLFHYINPAEPSQFDQQNVCSSLEDVNFASVKRCVNRTGCGNESPLALGEGQTLTVFKLMDLTEGICQPGCDSIEERLSNATRCYQFKQRVIQYLVGKLASHQITPTCSEVDTTIKCIRSQISFCEAAKDYLLLKMQIPAISTDVHYNCPEVDLSFTETQSSTSSMLRRKETSAVVLSVSLTLILVTTIKDLL